MTGQELLAKEMAYVPGGKGAGEGSTERDDKWALGHCTWDSGWGPVHSYLVLSII